MLNLRQIDSKFWLSGGWTDVPEDAKWFSFNEFRAVLDLQFTQDDYFKKSADFIKETLSNRNIEYLAIPMNDGENYRLENIFEVGYHTLDYWFDKYTHRRDKILIKCGVGVSRSVSMLIYYYCVRDRLTFTEAREIIRKVDSRNYGGLPISIEPRLEEFLRNKFPDISAFGER